MDLAEVCKNREQTEGLYEEWRLLLRTPAVQAAVGNIIREIKSCELGIVGVDLTREGGLLKAIKLQGIHSGLLRAQELMLKEVEKDERTKPNGQG